MSATPGVPLDPRAVSEPEDPDEADDLPPLRDVVHDESPLLDLSLRSTLGRVVRDRLTWDRTCGNGVGGGVALWTWVTRRLGRGCGAECEPQTSEYLARVATDPGLVPTVKLHGDADPRYAPVGCAIATGAPAERLRTLLQDPLVQRYLAGDLAIAVVRAAPPPHGYRPSPPPRPC